MPVFCRSPGVFIFGIFLLCFTHSVLADLPKTINYQGYLSENNGSPVSGVRDITFSLYTSVSGDTSVWSEQQATTIVNGLFSVELGAVNPVTSHLTGESLFLGILIQNENEELLPRTPITLTPFSARAEIAEKVVPGSIKAEHIGQQCNNDEVLVYSSTNTSTTGWHCGAAPDLPAGKILTQGPVIGSVSLQGFAGPAFEMRGFDFSIKADEISSPVISTSAVVNAGSQIPSLALNVVSKTLFPLFRMLVQGGSSPMIEMENVRITSLDFMPPAKSTNSYVIHLGFSGTNVSISFDGSSACNSLKFRHEHGGDDATGDYFPVKQFDYGILLNSVSLAEPLLVFNDIRIVSQLSTVSTCLAQAAASQSSIDNIELAIFSPLYAMEPEHAVILGDVKIKEFDVSSQTNGGAKQSMLISYKTITWIYRENGTGDPVVRGWDISSGTPL